MKASSGGLQQDRPAKQQLDPPRLKSEMPPSPAVLALLRLLTQNTLTASTATCYSWSTAASYALSQAFMNMVV